MIRKRDKKNGFKFVNLNHFKNQKSIERVMINLLPGDMNLNNTGKLKNKPINMDWLHMMTITETLQSVAASIQDHSRWCPPSGIYYILVLSLPISYKDWYGRSDSMLPPRQVSKDTKVAILVAPSLSQGSQLPRCKQPSLQRGIDREKLGPLPKSQQRSEAGQQPTEGTGKQILQSRQASDNHRPNRHLECNLVRYWPRPH